MAEISEAYIEKLRLAVRRSKSDATDSEIKDLCAECRADLASLGVLESKTDDENDPLVLGAVRCFVRWKFGLSNTDAQANREDYMQLRDELRKREGYGYVSQ